MATATESQWKTARANEIWDHRTKRIAALIPAGSHVLEFGCWVKRLSGLLTGGSYTGCDLYDRGPGTIICDLNKDLPAVGKFDVIVFGGVLEWVTDVPRVIEHLAQNTTSFVVSYAYREPYKYHTRENEFVKIFTERGFAMVHSARHEEYHLYKFERPHAGPVVMVDIDGTLCTKVEGDDYQSAQPIREVIDYVNGLKAQGYLVKVWTSRGAKTGKNWRDLTEQQLKAWGVHYDTLSLDKPHYDLWLDDKAIIPGSK